MKYPRSFGRDSRGAAGDRESGFRFFLLLSPRLNQN